jgi:transcription-repair coupling factor (superfamily II helicase)
MGGRLVCPAGPAVPTEADLTGSAGMAVAMNDLEIRGVGSMTARTHSDNVGN